MRKQLLSHGKSHDLIAALMIAVIAFGSASADPVEYTDSLFSWRLENREATLVKYVGGIRQHVDVPECVTCNGTEYRVTLLGESCFANANVKKVTMGKYVARIGYQAFLACFADTIITGSGVKDIDDMAFLATFMLNELALSPSVAHIGANVLINSHLSSLHLSDGVRDIDPYAFYSAKLNKIAVSDNNPYFKEENGILYNKSGNELVYYPAGLTETSVVVPGHVKKIWPLAFNCQGSMTELTLAEGVEEMGFETLSGSKIQTLNIPASLKYIGENPFKDCKSLASINVAQNNRWFDFTDNWFLFKGENRLLWHRGEFPSDVIVPDGIERLGAQLFINSSITSVTFPASLRKIGPYCFQGCANLAVIKGSTENIDTIQDFAFNKCRRLRHFNYSRNLRYIGECAFWQCGIINGDLPDGVTFLGYSAFRECDSLKSFSLAKAPEYIGNMLCAYSKNLKLAVLPKGLKKITPYMFAYCPSLKECNIPATVDSICDLAFISTPLEKLEIPASVIHIGVTAFYECTRLKEIIIPDNVKTIGRSCFNRCSSVTTVKIGTGLKAVAPFAFNPMLSLTTLELSEGLEKIEFAGFANCPRLREVTLPSTLTHIDTLAFSNDSLTLIRAKMKTPPSLKGNIFSAAPSQWADLSTDFSTCMLEVPAESIDLYKNAAVWKEFANIRTNSVTGIKNGSDVTIKEIYTQTGIRLSRLAPGQINILRMSDGSSRKVFIPR